jgi:Carboxypeptidase regulatory-like domain
MKNRRIGNCAGPRIKLGIGLAIVLLTSSSSFARPQSQDQSSPPPPSADKSNAQSATKDSEKPAAPAKQDKAKKSDDPPVTKLKIHVTDTNDKPVGNASIYVRFNESGGLFRKDKLSEMNFKTNQDGSVKVPDVPQGKILIQVVAKGLHTYGKWYEVDTDEESVEIKLEPAPHWY